MMRYFSMFSGIGGFELGIDRACNLHRLSSGEEPRKDGHPDIHGRDCSVLERNDRGDQAVCVGFSEIDKYAIKIYESHFGGHKNYGDATRIVPESLPDFDLLVGGFPCQAFSIAGKRLGFEDTRGTLFFDIARILKVKRPRMFLLENVKGLLSHDNGRTFKTIITTLAELGYGVEWQVLNSKNHGVPQNRERVFIVGHLGDNGGREVFPIGEGDGAVGAEIKRIGHNDIFRRYNQTYDPSGSVESLDTSGGGGHQPCVPNGARIRRLTPTECERLQGYPDGWTAGVSDSQRYKTLGNSVTVNVIQAIIERMI